MAGWSLRPPRARAFAAALAFLALFWVYVSTHVASLYLDDSGETVTAAALLGIGHPPGYPLHTLLAHLCTWLPLGSPAEPVNLLAAVLAASCGTAVFLLLLAAPLGGAGEASASAAPASVPEGTAPEAGEGLGYGGGLVAAALPAALLCLGPIYWHNALVAKGSIYHFNNLLSALLLAALAAPSLSPRRLRAFWLLLGLALAHHYMSQLPLLPAYAWLLWKGARRPFSGAWLALPGAALYLYIPLRASLDPGLNWGGVASFGDFWFFFSRMQYAGGELTRSVATSLSEARYALGLLLKEGYGVVPLAALAAAWHRRREPLAQALILGWLASLASVTLYLNLAPERLDLMEPYLFPAYLCQALLAGLGLASAFRGRGLGPFAGQAVPAACLGLVLALGGRQWPLADLSDYYFALDSARGLLLGLPKNALLLCQGDAVVFPLWYLQRVRKERTDVASLGLAVLPMDWVRRDLAERWPDLRHPRVNGPIGEESVPALTMAYLELNPQRPLYASFNQFDPGVKNWSLVSEGQDFRCVRALPAPAPDLDAAQKRLQAFPLRGYVRRPLDARTLKLVVGDLAVRYNVLGVAAEDAKDYARALELYQDAARVAPEDPVFPFNGGNVLYALGRKDEALEAFRRSTQVDPGYLNAWYNQAVTLYQAGRIPEARACFRRVYDLDPSREDVAQVLRQTGGL